MSKEKAPKYSPAQEKDLKGKREEELKLAGEVVRLAKLDSASQDSYMGNLSAELVDRMSNVEKGLAHVFGPIAKVFRNKKEKDLYYKLRGVESSKESSGGKGGKTTAMDVMHEKALRIDEEQDFKSTRSESEDER